MMRDEGVNDRKSDFLSLTPINMLKSRADIPYLVIEGN